MEYRRVFARPTRSADAFFTVLVGYQPGRPAKLGLAIAKKQVRRAVARNRLKRLIREVFRHERHALGGLHIVVLARSAAATAESTRLRNALRRHFARLATRTSTGPR